MKTPVWGLLILLFGLSIGCHDTRMANNPTNSMRGLIDTVGYANKAWQMDSVVNRITQQFKTQLNNTRQADGTVWKTAICPHDDHTAASWMYEAVLRNVTAKTVIIFGVAHKARQFNLENQLVLDSFKTWHGPYGPVKVSPLREDIIDQLPQDMFVVHDSMQIVEHSVEGIVPFLQYQNRDVEIISILVPYMEFERMKTISRHFAKSMQSIMENKDLHWGKDIAFVISSDAVHYGDEGWGGKNYAPYGVDSTGNTQAVDHEREIIHNCFDGQLSEEKIAQFFNYTVSEENFKEYKWTWCGRYSIPFGLLTSLNLQQLENIPALTGISVRL